MEGPKSGFQSVLIWVGNLFKIHYFPTELAWRAIIWTPCWKRNERIYIIVCMPLVRIKLLWNIIGILILYFIFIAPSIDLTAYESGQHNAQAHLATPRPHHAFAALNAATQRSEVCNELTHTGLQYSYTDPGRNWHYHIDPIRKTMQSSSADESPHTHTHTYTRIYIYFFLELDQ